MKQGTRTRVNSVTNDAGKFPRWRPLGGNRDSTFHASTQLRLPSPLLVADSMAITACTNHSYRCAERCSWLPLLMLLTFTVLAAKVAQTPHYRSCIPSCQTDFELAPYLSSISSLALTSKRPFIDMYKLPVHSYRRTSLCLIMVMICSDVEMNPGPVKYPWISCQLPVAKIHRALGCDSCGNWVHIKCCGVTPTQYAAFQRDENPVSWNCLVCNPVDASANLSSSDSDSFNESLHSEPTTPPTDSTHGKPRKCPGNIKVLVINVRSVRSRGKAGALKAHIVDTKADIVIANETKITPDLLTVIFYNQITQRLGMTSAKINMVFLLPSGTILSLPEWMSSEQHVSLFWRGCR